jgi:hypothetical protein
LRPEAVGLDEQMGICCNGCVEAMQTAWVMAIVLKSPVNNDEMTFATYKVNHVNRQKLLLIRWLEQ